MSEALGSCPRCGRPEGRLRDIGRSRFRYYVICGACQWMTAIARTEGIAANLEKRRAAFKGR